MTKRTRRAGFTLLELMIVVSIMSILGALALPRLRSAGYEADAAMRTLQSTLQQAQRVAIVNQIDVLVSFDSAGRRVRVVYDLNQNRQYDFGEPIRWKPLGENDRFVAPGSGPQFGGAAAVLGPNIVLRDSYPTVVYHRDGAVSTEFEVYLSSYRPTATDRRALHVRQATGRVQTYRYDGATWQGIGL